MYYACFGDSLFSLPQILADICESDQPSISIQMLNKC